MVGACEIITQCFGRISAQEDRPCMADIRQIFEGIIHAYFQMLRRDLIGNLDGLCNAVYNDDLTVIVDRCSGNFRSGQQRDLFFQFFRYCLCQCCAFCYQYGRCHFVMLRLRKQVSRHYSRIGLAVSNHQNFTGACDHIDGNLSEDLFFRFRNKGIAGADDLIHAGHGFCTIGQSRYRLCAADLKDTVYTSNFRRRNDIGIQFAALGRSHHADFLYTRNFRRDAVHQNCGRIAGCAAGHIKPYPVQRDDLLSQNHTGAFCNNKVRTFLFFMESADMICRFLQDFHKLRIGFRQSCRSFLCGNLQHLCRRTVELFTVFFQGCIAVFAYICNDFRNNIRNGGFFFFPCEYFFYFHVFVIISSDHGSTPHYKSSFI